MGICSVGLFGRYGKCELGTGAVFATAMFFGSAFGYSENLDSANFPVSAVVAVLSLVAAAEVTYQVGKQCWPGRAKVPLSEQGAGFNTLDV